MWKTAALLGAAVVLTRWPFRSHALFSWDSANFAMALDRIDIASHRPHPPGYLGYVFAARSLRHLFPDGNTALVVWNLIATTLATLITAFLAFDVSPPGKRRLTAVAVAAILLTSPLIWFYGEVAEIYPSELLFAALVGFTAARAVRGSDRAMYACVAALALTAAFKVVTAFLMFPAVVFAWTRVSAKARWWSFSLVAIAAMVVIIGFVLVQPDLWTVAKRLVQSSDWLIWYLNTDQENLFRVLNRNLRNTFVAAVIGIGIVNFAGVIVWAAADRRIPARLSSGLAWAWVLPILLFCIVLVIAKPGYLLPFVPLAAIIVGGFYASFRPRVAVALTATQAIVNIMHFLFLAPFSPSVTGGEIQYRSKPIWQRLASDLQPITYPTRFTVKESDERVQQLIAFVGRSCSNQRPVIVADIAPVDWRRVMFYFPDATAIHFGGTGVDFIGHQMTFVGIPPEGEDVVSRCPVLWLSPDGGPGGIPGSRDPSATTVAYLGWTTPAGTLHVTPTGITQTPTLGP